MADNGTLGDRLRRKRQENSLTQEELAHLSGISQVMIAKIEQGRRQPRLPVLTRLSTALDIPLSELLDNRPRLDGHREGASILAIRDALLSPSQLPGIDLSSDDGEPTPLPQLRATVADAARLYWAGSFAPLAAMLPALIGEGRLTAQSAGPPASSLLAQTYDLTAVLMVHMGKEDLAALAAERAVTAALASDDEFLHALLEGTYAWVLLHQGRLGESEQLAATIADRVEPSFSAPAEHLAVWGTLLMTALAPAAAAGRDVSGYISLASAGAERLGRRVSIYQTSFCASYGADAGMPRLRRHPRARQGPHRRPQAQPRRPDRHLPRPTPPRHRPGVHRRPPPRRRDRRADPGTRPSPGMVPPPGRGPLPSR